MVIELVAGSSARAHWSFGDSPGPVSVVIGTAGDCHWRIAGAGVAAHHLLCHWTGQALWVAPAGPDPVFVDARPLAGWNPVGRGASLGLGAARLVVLQPALATVEPLSLDPHRTMIVVREPTPLPEPPAPAHGALDSLFVSPPPSPRGFGRRRSRPLVAIGLVGLAAAVVAAVWFEEAQALSAMRAAARPVVTAIAQPEVAAASPLAPAGEPGRADPHEAALLLLAGNEEQALGSYRQLAGAGADRAVFSLIARLLQQRIEARCGSRKKDPCPPSSSP